MIRSASCTSGSPSSAPTRSSSRCTTSASSGVPRRYYEYGETAFIPHSVAGLNVFITVAALIVGAAQMLFFFNLVWSLFRGRPSGGNPWRAASLEWQTPQTPPGHGNWGKDLPVVYRWAYDYSRPGAEQDFIPQNRTPGRRTGRRLVTVLILFLAAVAAIGGWWLSRQRLASMPWLETGPLGVRPRHGSLAVAGGEARAWVLPRGGRLPVRAPDQRLPHARRRRRTSSGAGREAASVGAAVGQHGRAGRRQRRLAPCGRRGTSRPARRRAGRISRPEASRPSPSWPVRCWRGGC